MTTVAKRVTSEPGATPALSPLHVTLDRIERQTDARFLNRILNDPSVYPFVHGNLKGPMDASVIVADPANVLLTGELGALLFVQHQPGFYEVHSQCLPEGRGAWMLSFVRACLHWMFTCTDAVDIQTRCPQGNVPALALAKRIHGRFLFTRADGWIMDGVPISADIYGLNIQDWAASAPGLVERGHWFHERLEAEYARHGVADPAPHPDDETHDRYAGMACEMILGGQGHKAAVFYNRWAVMAGYAPITIIKATPPTVTVDIQDAIIIVRPDGTFWVTSTRRPSLAKVH